MSTLDDFKKMKIVRKTDLDLARDKVTEDIYKRFYDLIGINDMYHLGMVTLCEFLLNVKGELYLNKSDIKKILEDLKEQNEISENIKSVIDEVIKEHE